ncbi:hypothetical protein D3C78_1154130 [compost metagenome]
MRLGQRAQTIIHTRIHIHDVTVFFNRIDCRHETCALQTVTIQVVWRNIGGRHQRNAACE